MTATQRSARNDVPTRVVLVEDDPGDARRIQEALGPTPSSEFHVEWVRRLDDALTCVRCSNVDVLLLDLRLPDGQGIAVFDQMLAAAPHAMIVILCATGDEGVAHQAVERGAQDYLITAHVNAHWLKRSLHYLIERKANQDALRASEARFRAISDASPLGIFVADEQGDCIYTNAAYHKISGLNFEQTLGTHWIAAIHPDDRESVLAEWRAAARGEEPFQAEYRFLREDGSIVWTRVSSAPMLDASMQHGRVKTVEDISERKAAELKLYAAEDALFDEKERAQVTLDSIGDAVLSTDLDGRVSYLNRTAEAMTGWSIRDAVGRPLAEVFNIIDGDTQRPAANPSLQAIMQNRNVGLADNCVLVSRDGREAAIEDSAAPIHSRDGQVAGAVIVFHDVSETRAMALKMSHLAQHDYLTGLPNRMLLTERLSWSIKQAQRHGKKVALLFLDLDHFKNVNDSLGHAVGDRLLQSVGERLTANVRATDTVYRHGGDEFVILLAEIEQPNDAAHIAEKMLAAFAVPHPVSGQELHITLSIGVSVYPDDGVDLDAMLQNADAAMYHAKTCGRNTYQFFRQDMSVGAVRRLHLENSMRRALKLGEFVLYYQPKVDLATSRISGVEALIRWRDPEQGLVLPEQFIPVAEQCGLIVPIGRWVLREACMQIQRWLDSGLDVVPVAVNLSAVEFKDRRFLASVTQILAETGVDPRYLEMELTEGILMHDVEASISVLSALKVMGLRLAIDDFGTGYSSLSYLKRFPIDTLKIDQSFVHDIATDADDATIVSAVIGMGRSLDHCVVAEGVETIAQFSFLRTRQCPVGQGYLFSHPLAAADFATLLATGRIELAA